MSGPQRMKNNSAYMQKSITHRAGRVSLLGPPCILPNQLPIPQTLLHLLYALSSVWLCPDVQKVCACTRGKVCKHPPPQPPCTKKKENVMAGSSCVVILVKITKTAECVVCHPLTQGTLMFPWDINPASLQSSSKPDEVQSDVRRIKSMLRRKI